LSLDKPSVAEPPRLLFDANLSPKLVGLLADIFPGSLHVFDSGLARFASDEAIWEFAKARRLIIVTADSDFVGLARQGGSPPWVVRLENCRYKNAQVEALLRRNSVRIRAMENSSLALLIIRRPI
jgi:predicted nuclease of predicted toxin-antitoxin system